MLRYSACLRSDVHEMVSQESLAGHIAQELIDGAQTTSRMCMEVRALEWLRDIGQDKPILFLLQTP